MNAGDILYARLVAAATTAGTRIYPVQVPLEADLPALAYEVTLDDGVDGTAPIQRVAIRIDAVAQTDDAAQALALAVDAALENYSARDGDTYLRPLQRNGWSEIRDSEFNAWVRQVSYRAWISY